MSEPLGRQPSLLASALRVFDLSLGQMLWSRRSVFLGLVAGGPVLLAGLIRTLTVIAVSINTTNAPGRGPLGDARRLAEGSLQIDGLQVDGAAVFGIMIWLMYVRFIVPVLGVFYGTSLIADEVDDKTITYLFTRPIQRSAVLVGKYMAYVVCTVLLLLPSVMLVYFLVVPIGGRSSIAGTFPSLLSDLGMLAVGLAAYGAVFTFIGTRLKRPLLVGLLLVLGWEPLVMAFPGYLKRLTVAYYLQGLVVHEMPDDSAMSLLLQVFREVPPLFTSLVALAVIIVAGVWLAGRTVEQREYVLDQ